jgi:hypothetical protein
MKGIFMQKMLLFVIIFVVSGYSAITQLPWSQLVNKRVKCHIVDSGVIAGKVIYYQDPMVTILTYDNVLTTIETEDVEYCYEVKVTCGPVFGLNFGTIGFNAEIHNLNLFANASPLLPVYFQGHLYTCSSGVGRLVSLGTNGWKLNLFTNVSVATISIIDDWLTVVAAGLGIGFQYTGNNRFLCSFKIPVIGYTISPATVRENIVNYYLLALLSLPLIEFGASF